MNTNTLQFRPRLSPSKKREIQKHYNALLNARIKRQTKLLRPVSQIGKEARKQFGKLVTKQELKASKALADHAQKSIAKLFLPNKVNVNPAKIKSLRRFFKNAFKAIFKEIEAIQKLKSKHKEDVINAFAHIETSESIFDNIITDIPDINALPELQVISFRPPYAFSEVFGVGFTPGVKRDDSFADTQSGFVLNDFDFSYKGGGSFNPVTVFDSFAGMGFRYTLPATGVIKITAVMQNTLSLFQASIKDNFGFSDGNVRMSAGIYMDVFHPNNLEMSEKFSLAFLSLSSGGDDVSASESDLQTITPYIITLISTGAFSQGETVDIVVGSKVHIRSHLDDMTCHLTARVGWQVKEVFIEVI